MRPARALALRRLPGFRTPSSGPHRGIDGSLSPRAPGNAARDARRVDRPVSRADPRAARLGGCPDRFGSSGRATLVTGRSALPGRRQRPLDRAHEPMELRHERRANAQSPRNAVGRGPDRGRRSLRMAGRVGARVAPVWRDLRPRRRTRRSRGRPDVSPGRPPREARRRRRAGVEAPRRPRALGLRGPVPRLAGRSEGSDWPVLAGRRRARCCLCHASGVGLRSRRRLLGERRNASRPVRGTRPRGSGPPAGSSRGPTARFGPPNARPARAPGLRRDSPPGRPDTRERVGHRSARSVGARNAPRRPDARRAGPGRRAAQRVCRLRPDAAQRRRRTRQLRRDGDSFARKRRGPRRRISGGRSGSLRSRSDSGRRRLSSAGGATRQGSLPASAFGPRTGRSCGRRFDTMGGARSSKAATLFPRVPYPPSGPRPRRIRCHRRSHRAGSPAAGSPASLYGDCTTRDETLH